MAIGDMSTELLRPHCSITFAPKPTGGFWNRADCALAGSLSPGEVWQVKAHHGFNNSPSKVGLTIFFAAQVADDGIAGVDVDTVNNSSQVALKVVPGECSDLTAPSDLYCECVLAAMCHFVGACDDGQGGGAARASLSRSRIRTGSRIDHMARALRVRSPDRRLLRALRLALHPLPRAGPAGGQWGRPSRHRPLLSTCRRGHAPSPGQRLTPGRGAVAPRSLGGADPGLRRRWRQ